MPGSAQKAAKTAVKAMDHAGLIDALGGPVAVAGVIRESGADISDEAVYNMRRRGQVAWAYRNLLAEKAKAAGFDLPTNFLGRGV